MLQCNKTGIFCEIWCKWAKRIFPAILDIAPSRLYIHLVNSIINPRRDNARMKFIENPSSGECKQKMFWKFFHKMSGKEVSG